MGTHRPSVQSIVLITYRRDLLKDSETCVFKKVSYLDEIRLYKFSVATSLVTMKLAFNDQPFKPEQKMVIHGNPIQGCLE